MQVNTTMRYHFTRMTIIKKTTSLVRMWRNLNPNTLLVRTQNGTAVVENNLVVKGKHGVTM